MPLAVASDEERLAEQAASTRSTPDELAQLYRLMSRLRAGDAPAARLAGNERGRHGRRIDMRRTLRAQPAHGRRPDAARPPAPARRCPAGW